MKNLIKDVSINQTVPHPVALESYKAKDLSGLKFVLKYAGQLEPVKVVKRGNKYLIFDGISRYYAFLALGDENTIIRIEIFNYTDEEVKEQFALRNYKTKRTLKELCNQAKAVLDILGSSQGKARTSIGNLIMEDEDSWFVGKEKLELACVIVGCEFSASTLGRLLKVNEFEEDGDSEVKGLALMDKLDNKVLKINTAYSLMNSYKKDKEEQGTNAITETIEFVKGNHFELYNSTCEDLSNIPDESVNTAATSCPYFQQKIYPIGNLPQGIIPHGEEPNVDEFVAKQKKIASIVRQKLKDTGSYFLNISDSYDRTHLMISNKLIQAFVDDGWYLVQEIIWEKENQKPTSATKKLLPTYEKILHFVKDPDRYYYREFKHWKLGGEFTLSKSNSCDKKEIGWSLTRPLERFRNFLNEQHVKNIIHSPIYHWSELQDIDPKFRHKAPFASYIPLLPILMTTKPGDTVLDIYSGTGTTASVAVQLGRNAIGFDTDTISHQFAVKRLTMVEQNLPSQEEIQSFEDEFMMAA